ncbi:MAG: ImmA/IrrE family metallo-endopeptidase [Terracidiphilus sp.]
MDRPLTGIRADEKHSYSSIERLAVGLREMLSLGSMDRFDALKFFDEIVPDMTIECRAGTIHLCEAVENCLQEGHTKWDRDANLLEIGLSGKTYAQLQEGHPRARYTVVHEAGHACLHTDQIIRLGGMDVSSQVALHRERTPHDACQDTEWQANAFGSAVLMPAEGVERLFSRLGRISAHALSETFGVSLESATYRIGTYERSLGR